MSCLIENDTLVKYTDQPGVFHVTLPDNVLNVDRKAFDGCDILKTVTGANVRSIGKIWGDHEIKGARRDLCLIFPNMDIRKDPSYTFKMALCLGFLRAKDLYSAYREHYEAYARVQKNWLLKSLIGANSDELLSKALDYYLVRELLSREELENIYLPFASESENTLSSAVIINTLNEHFKKNPLDDFDL